AEECRHDEKEPRRLLDAGQQRGIRGVAQHGVEEHDRHLGEQREVDQHDGGAVDRLQPPRRRTSVRLNGHLSAWRTRDLRALIQLSSPRRAFAGSLHLSSSCFAPAIRISLTQAKFMKSSRMRLPFARTRALASATARFTSGWPGLPAWPSDCARSIMPNE